MSIIAVRRSLQGQTVFFRPELNHVYYSFDKVTWLYGWSLPVGGTSNYWDFSKSVDYYIEQYNNQTVQNSNFNTIINNQIVLPKTRDEAMARIEEITNQIYSDRKLCRALKYILQIARDLGIAVQNGSIEPDDAKKVSDFANNVIPVVGGYVAVLIDVGSQAIADMSQITDEQLEDYLCCIYQALSGGAFSYSNFVTAGTNCGLGAWDEIATTEMYSFLCALLTNDPLEGACPCEDCIVFNGAGGQVLNGAINKKSLITTAFNTGGTVFEMQARATFNFPSMIITRVEAYSINDPYENVATATPYIRFTAPNTGGGNVSLTPNTISATVFPANYYPLVPVTECTIGLITSTCSACSTAQRATFDESWGALMAVRICGTLA